MIHKLYYYSISSLVFLLLSCGSKTGKTGSTEDSTLQTAIPVIADSVRMTTSGSEISVSGNVEGNKTVRLGFMVGGKISYIAAQEGQTVRSGQLIATLDPAIYSIAKQTADVQVRQVTDEYNRLKIMYDRGSVSESDFKKVGFALEQAKNQQRLQAQNLAYTKLYSSIGGVLLKRLAETGEITGVGNPILVISDISKVKVNAYIPENELHTIKLGQPATVEIAALDATYQGKVTEVGSAADPASRAFTVKIEVSNPKLLIRPGMIAEVKLSSNESRSVLTVPAEAVLRDTDGQSYIYIVDTRQGKVFRRNVSPGALVNNRIEISNGLNKSDMIVTGGQQKLSDGASVTITK